MNGAKGGLKSFLIDVVRGCAIGVAFIIPGFSGGSVAAILGIYEKLVGAIADIFKDFKKSILTLLPILIGMVCGIVALLFPLEWALGAYPIPTVCIFVGLALGGLPSITDKLGGKIKVTNIFAFVIPLAAAFSLSFLPIGSDIDLFSLGIGGYALLFIVGLIGSSALVIPGISGSMLLLILGYYNPIVSMVTDNLLQGKNVGLSLAILGVTGLGVVAGFVLISVIMKRLLISCPRGTHFAILGFILGSIPTIFISTVKESGLSFSALMPNWVFWLASVLLLLAGTAISLALVIFSKRKLNKDK